MAYNVVLSATARADVRDIARWLRDQISTAAADRWLERFSSKLNSLTTLPERCPLAAEAADVGFELREAQVGKRASAYRILFEIRSQTVEVLHVRHTARDAVTPDDFASDDAD